MFHRRTTTLTGALVVLGLLAVPTTAGALGRPAGTAAATPSQPPTITENFKPVLPCNPNTTIGQEGCGEHQALAADKQLNADVKVIFDLLSTSSARQDFVRAQTAWAAYRTADCKSQSDTYQGGSEQPVAYVDCLAPDDSSRRADLKGFYGVLTQGRADVPKFP
jgi:uncharacterized protein YecT (DUF1311 family)